MMQTFPIPRGRVCMMRGDGAQIDIAMKVGQDARPAGWAPTAVTTTVIPFAGQNGCFDIPWVVNGGYIATIARSGAASSFGYCATGFVADRTSQATRRRRRGSASAPRSPSSPRSRPCPAGRATVNGSIVTGADNHAVQVCVSAFSPTRPRRPAPVQQLANKVNAYNQSGAVNLTPLDSASRRHGGEGRDVRHHGAGAGRPGGRAVRLPDGDGEASGRQITAISVPDVPNATIIDQRGYVVQ